MAAPGMTFTIRDQAAAAGVPLEDYAKTSAGQQAIGRYQETGSASLPPSAYLPDSGTAGRGGSTLVNGVQMVPGAPGFDPTNPQYLNYLKTEIAPYDPSVVQYLRNTIDPITGQSMYDATAQAAVERVAREDALREAARQAVASGQISQAEAQNIVTGVTPPPANIQTNANTIAQNRISFAAGLNDMSTITGVNPPVSQDLLDRNTGGVTTPSSSYVQGMTSPLPPGAGESTIDPTIEPYLGESLARSRYLFLTGEGPQLYPDQMFVSPSTATLDAIMAAENLGRSTTVSGLGEDVFGAYAGGLGTLANLASPDYMKSQEYKDYVSGVTRPITEAVTEDIIPGIQSGFSKAGRYGSGAMGDITAKATGRAATAIGDVTSRIAQQERQNQFNAATALPGFLSNLSGVTAGALAPSGVLAGVGAQREAIAAQPLQELIQRFEYQQNLPYNMLSGYLSSIYGSPLGGFTGQPEMQGNSLLSDLGSIANIAGTIGKAGSTDLGKQFTNWLGVTNY